MTIGYTFFLNVKFEELVFFLDTETPLMYCVPFNLLFN